MLTRRRDDGGVHRGHATLQDVSPDEIHDVYRNLCLQLAQKVSAPPNVVETVLAGGENGGRLLSARSSRVTAYVLAPSFVAAFAWLNSRLTHTL